MVILTEVHAYYHAKFHPAANYMFRDNVETLEQGKLTIRTPE